MAPQCQGDVLLLFHSPVWSWLKHPLTNEYWFRYFLFSYCLIIILYLSISWWFHRGGNTVIVTGVLGSLYHRLMYPHVCCVLCLESKSIQCGLNEGKETINRSRVYYKKARFKHEGAWYLVFLWSFSFRHTILTLTWVVVLRFRPPLLSIQHEWPEMVWPKRFISPSESLHCDNMTIFKK